MMPLLSCCALIAAGLPGAMAAGAPHAPLPPATPQSQGLSGARLRRMSEFFRIAAARHEAPGYVMMVARHGRLVYQSAVGYRDIERRQPMTLATRFRIASMTTEPAKRAITIRDLLTQQSGLGYAPGFDGREYLSPVTVDLMTHNQVPADAMEKYWGADSVGLGYGLGVGVEIDARHAPQAGFNGDYAWGGILDTHWLASPKTGIVAVLMTQIDPVGGTASGRTDADFRNLLFAAVRAPARAPSGR